jgi:mRNA interferase MazF
MSLQFHPKPGAIVLADFPTDYLHGEMVKRRPVIVVSKRFVRGRQACATVVPISMTAPHVVEAHHVVVPATAMPKGLRDKAGTRFAICNCVNTLSLARMDLVAGPRIGGRRSYETTQVSSELLLVVRRAVALLELHETTRQERIDLREATY